MMNFKRRKSFDDAPTSNKYANLGTESKRLQNAQNPWVAQAASTGMQNTSVAQLPLEIDIDPLLKDIVFSEDLEQKKLVNRLYRDIYYNDPVCGSAVDMFSTLPFSEFTFGGVTDKKARQAFAETIERLNCRTLMPHISTDHLVDGSYISSLLFNKSSKRFFDTMPHRSSDCKVETLPFYSQDPIITAAISNEIRALFASTDSKRMNNMRDRLGPELVALLGNDAIELDPLTTVYIPRKIFTTDEGVSWFRRVLPIWLIEKNLFRGTLVESSRRQRGILHLELGDGDQWEPTIADMEFITELFQNADADPLGAIIATRMGVSTNEIRCLTGETLVSTDKGPMRIDEIVGHLPNGAPFSAPTDVKVLSPAGGFVAVDQWHYQGFQKTTTLTTESGANLTATPNHKHLVLTSNGELQLALVKDITARHRLCVVDNEKFSNRKRKSTSEYDILASPGFHFESIVGIKGGGYRHVYDLSIAGNEDGEAPLFVANGIVTHNSGGDFWKVTDIWDSTSQFKMRALGISESFLCLAGSTLVHTEKGGLRRIDSICDDVVREKDSYESVHFKLKGANNQLCTANRWWYRGESPTITLTSFCGYNITCTPEHQIKVLTAEGLLWRKAKDIQIGKDYFLTDVVVVNAPAKQKLKVPEFACNAKRMTFPKYMTEELAYVLGFVIADGQFTRDGLSACNTDVDILKKFVKCCKTLGFSDARFVKSTRCFIGDEISICGIDTVVTKQIYNVKGLSSRSFVEFCRVNGVTIPANSYTHTVPTCILEASTAHQMSFLAGIIDGDGTTQGDCFSIHSRSKLLLRQIQIMLTNAGIVSRIMEKYHRLTLTAHYSSMLQMLIGEFVACAYKQVDSESTSRRDAVPNDFVASLLKARHSHREVNVGEWFYNDQGSLVLIERFGQLFSRNFGAVVGKGTARRSKALLLRTSYRAGMYDSWLEALKTISLSTHASLVYLLDSDYFFDVVVSSKDAGVQKVYDLSIAKGNAPAFVANGILVHNSGEANLGTADNSMTLLIETIRTFRDMITRKFFYDKLFPLISLVNGFTINDAGKLIRKDGLLTGDIQDNLNKLANGSRLLVPTIHWNKQLKPEGDSTYIDILATLTEKGIPVPLRAFAAAGGFNLDNLLNDSEDDIVLLKKISEYNKKVADIKKEYGPAVVAEDMAGMASAGGPTLLKALADAKQSPSSVLREGTGRRVPLAARDFGESGEIVGRTPTGKKKYLRNQKQENEKANKTIARAIREITKHKHTPLTRSTITAHTGA